MCVAVNLSPVQFKSRTLVATVAQALHDADMPAERLELEITETVMLQDTDATLATLGQLRDLGVRIAMDDFGTGYSSLSYLRRFPFDRIKIDQSFVRDINSKRDCGAIIRAVAGLSRELGMATTAEGVETQAQLDALVSAGCTEVQGYLFSRPVTSDAVTGLRRSIEEMLRPARAEHPALAELEADTGPARASVLQCVTILSLFASSPTHTVRLCNRGTETNGRFRRHPCAIARLRAQVETLMRDRVTPARRRRGRPCRRQRSTCGRRRARPGRGSVRQRCASSR